MINYIFFIVFIFFLAIHIAIWIIDNNRIYNKYYFHVDTEFSALLLIIISVLFAGDLMIWGISYSGKSNNYNRIEIASKNEDFLLPESAILKINEKIKRNQKRNQNIFFDSNIPDKIMDIDTIPISRASNCIFIPKEYLEKFNDLNW
mgnify:CR=1 FL=1